VLFAQAEFSFGPMDLFVEGSSRELKSHFISSRDEERSLDQEVSRPCRGRGRGSASCGIREEFRLYISGEKD
jgi:hypothetical protein